jgi:hypothetical protein
MTSKRNDTLIDIDRREIAFIEHQVENILPAFFRTEYPKLISLLKEYYHFDDEETSAARLIHDLFYSRDITQTDVELLTYIEDELLLGQSYFEGFTDKRAAAKYSNQLYRSKGTQFSIEQFFRTFFGVDPEITYTKKQVFQLNGGDDFKEIELDALMEASIGSPAFPATTYGQLDSDGARLTYQNYLKDNYRPTSRIGFESQKYLTNDKLYQTFALLVKTDISTSEWIQPYKLFAHPAGMYVGSEVQIVSVVEDTMTAPNVVLEPPPPIAVHSTASFGDTGLTDLTAIVDDLYTDSAGVYSRINAEFNSVEDFSLEEIQTINNQYSSLREAQIASSPTFDDSDEVGTNGMDLSNNYSWETLDQQKHQWWSADSDQYLKSFTL